MKQIIVCGYSRSGTTMFYNMLRSSVSGYEFFDREIQASKVIGLGPQNAISKNPRDIFRLERITKANILSKEIILLILIRDIRSIITSYHSAVPDDYFMAYDLCYSPDQKGDAPYNGPGIIPTAKAIKKAVDNPDFQSIVVRYEDLVSSPRAQEERIRERAGLKFTAHFEDFHEHPIPKRLTRQLNGPRPIDRSRLDAWRSDEHAQRIRSQFTRCPALFDLLIAYDYEQSNDWFERYRRKAPPGTPGEP